MAFLKQQQSLKPEGETVYPNSTSLACNMINNQEEANRRSNNNNNNNNNNRRTRPVPDNDEVDNGDDEANVNVTDTQEDGKAEVNNAEAYTESEDVDSKDGDNANNDDSIAFVNWQYTNTGDEFHQVYDDVGNDYSWDEDDYNGA